MELISDVGKFAFYFANIENMKKIKIILAIIAGALFLTGCGMTGNMAQNHYVSQTNVVLSNNNFHIVKTVEAEVSASYWFGFGGLDRKALKDNAVSELTKKAQLTGHQALKRSDEFYLIFRRTTFYAEGTVIEFDR